MKNRLVVIMIVVLLSLLGGGVGATAGQLTQAPADQKSSPQQQPGQIKLEFSPSLAIGSGFTYQGRLVIGGNPASGNYDLVFTLFDAATGGNQIGSPITVLTQTLSIGTFTVPLDFGSSAFQGDARWLQISVRPSGSPTYTILSPRQALTPAPYALSLKPGAVISGAISNGGVLTTRANSHFGYALEGDNADGIGIYGTSINSRGVVGESTNGNGTYGTSSNGDGVQGFSGNANGVEGFSVNGNGVTGQTGGAGDVGVRGIADNGTSAKGVSGSSVSGFGGYFTSTNGVGVYSVSSSGTGLTATGGGTGAILTGGGTGIDVSGGNTGVDATGGTNAVRATGGSGSTGVGVAATGGSRGVDATGGTAGVNTTGGTYGVISSGGVYGVYSTGGSRGVYANGNSYGVYANSNNTGVYANSSGPYGLYAETSYTGTAHGVHGESNYIGGYFEGNYSGGYFVGNANYGVYALGQGDGVYATSPSIGLYARGSAWAGYFQGNIHVTGNSSAGAASYEIDDPTDPQTKTLSQSFVASPDMMNIYNGNVTTDANGDATITMPDWFDSLNSDFRYQLTPVGQFAQAMVSSEMKDNKFSIKTDKPNVKVSWQVTGIRQDAYANAHRTPVEQTKTGDEQGKYLHPTESGQPESMGVDYGKNPPAQEPAAPPKPKFVPRKAQPIFQQEGDKTMKKNSLLIMLALLLALLGGGIGATAGPLTQSQGDQKGQPRSGQPGQIKLESSPSIATGSGFTYQGRLVMGGSPASGSYDFTFSLYDASTGGNQIGPTITVLSQTLSIGTLTVPLDFGSSAFQGDARWLQISVRPSGDPTYTILSPGRR